MATGPTQITFAKTFYKSRLLPVSRPIRSTLNKKAAEKSPSYCKGSTYENCRQKKSRNRTTQLNDLFSLGNPLPIQRLLQVDPRQLTTNRLDVLLGRPRVEDHDALVRLQPAAGFQRFQRADAGCRFGTNRNSFER